MANTKITSRVLADNAVLTANITDANVTTAKVADNAVTGDKVADDVALAGNPTTTTQSAGNNTTRIATTAFVTTAVADLADSAPDALNTLNELAAALGDDANFSTTITNSIAAKLPLAGGTMTGALDLDGQELKLDADADTSITADTDDVVDFKVGGTDRLRLAGNNLFLNGGTDARIQLGSGGAGANQVSNNTVHIRGDGVDAKYMAASGGDHIFESNGGHLVTMKDSGNIGIGTTSPSSNVEISSSDDTRFKVTDTGDSSTFWIRGDGDNTSIGNTTNHPLAFIINNSEKMRIDTSGRVAIGNTVASSMFAGASSLVAGDGVGDDGITIYSGNASLARIHFADGTSGSEIYAGFVAYDHNENDMLLGGKGNGSTIMTLEANGSVGAPSGTNIYNASDRRVKQNISTLSDSLAIVKALNPVKFNWIKDFSKSENDKTLYGFIAQEVQTVFPDAVEDFATGQPIQAGDVTVDNPLAVREKFLIPVLVKAIQEQQEQIETLKKEVEELKGG